MTAPSSTDAGIDKAVMWLADTVRNRGIVVESMPEELRSAFHLEPDDKLFSLPLDYEPRSLAVSPSGVHVAVGTKAGAVKVASFGEKKWEAQSLPPALEVRTFEAARNGDREGKSAAKPKDPRHAIRVLHWIGADILLVGFGREFKLFGLRGSEWTELASDESDAKSPFEAFFANPASDPVANRDRRAVDTLALVDSSWSPPENQCTVALIKTENGKVRPVWVGKPGGTWSLKIGNAELPGEYLRDQNGSPIGSDADIVDVFGGEQGSFILLSNGEVFSIANCNDALSPALTLVCKLPTPFGMAGDHFDGVRAAKQGFGLRCGDMFTALPWRVLNESEEVRAVWVPIPGGRSFEVMQPVDAKLPHDKEPFWMLVATDKPGLTWVAWYEKRDPKPTRDHQLKKNKDHQVRWVLLSKQKDRSYAGMRNSEVLALRVAGQLSRGGRRTLSLITATRDHHLCIAPFINIRDARAELYQRMVRFKSGIKDRVAVPTPGASGSERGPNVPTDRGAWDEQIPSPRGLVSRIDIASAGVVLWCVKASMCQDFGVDPKDILGGKTDERLDTVFGVLEFEQIPRWGRRLNGDDLRELAQFVGRVLRESRHNLNSNGASESARNMDPHDPARAVLAYRMWTTRLLRRASELRNEEPNVSQDVASRLYAHLAQMRGEGTERLRQLASLLRKWVLRGGTYRSKETRLLDLARWNWDCGRDLDALVYAVRLLRRRVDLVATSQIQSVSHTPGILDLVVAPAGYAIHSHHDGRICATDVDGTTLKFESLPEGLVSEGDSIGLFSTGDFRETYGHGPHARALALQSDGTSDYLFFAFQALEPYQQVTLWVLHLSKDKSTLKITGSASHKFEDKASDQTKLSMEVHALNVLQANGKFVVLAGMRSSASDKTETKEFALRPVRFDPTMMELVEETAVVASDSDVDQRSTGIADELQYDPTWQIASLASHRGHDVAIGRHDGTIKMLHRSESGIWQAKQLKNEKTLRLRVVGSISSLEMSNPDGCGSLVAFGTTAGHYGVWQLEGKARNEAADSLDHNILLVHGEERSWIRAVRFYKDEFGVAYLLAASEQGRCVIANIDRNRAKRSRERISYSGLRVDRFRITTDVGKLPDFRAVRMGTSKNQSSNAEAVLGSRPPELVVGAVDGEVRRYELSVPLDTRRRHTLFNACRSMFPEDVSDAFLRNSGSGTSVTVGEYFERPLALDTLETLRKIDSPVESLSGALGLAGAVGGEWIWRLLRVWDETGDELLRFVLWAEMEVRKKTAFETESGVDALIGRAKNLAEEVYRRQPFSPDAIKIIIDSLGRVANELAGQALRERNAKPLVRCHDLQRLTENLCWQWAGADGTIEASLLMHAFEVMFDWTSIFLLSVNVNGEREGADIPDEQYLHCYDLVYRVLQTRLFHQDPVVTVDTLRVMNAALLRALDHLYVRGELPTMVATLSRDDATFSNLLSMVGEVIYRRFRERPAAAEEDPLLTEAYRFFGASLLLCPRHALGVGMIVSESRTPNVHRVGDYARVCLETLKQEAYTKKFDDPRNVNILEEAIEAFDVYLGRQTVLGQPASESEIHDWPAERGGWATTSDVRNEQKLINNAIRELEDLGEPLLDEDPPHTSIELVNRVDHENWRYFKHSRAVIIELAELRSTLLDRIKRNSTEDPEDVPRILAQAYEKVSRPAALFQPQREQFQGLVKEWERSSNILGRSAAGWVLFLQGHNRHKYQAGASNLLAAVAELAITSAPFTMDITGAGDLRAALQKNVEPVNPALVRVLDRAGLLADDARLTAAVLHAVMHKGKIVGNSRLKRLVARFELAARARGMKGQSSIISSDDERMFHGPDFVWAAIFYEVAYNASRHAEAREIVISYDNHDRALMMTGGKFLRGPASKTARDIEADLKNAEWLSAGGSGFGLRMIQHLCRAINVDIIPRHGHPDERYRIRDLPEEPGRENLPLMLVFQARNS